MATIDSPSLSAAAAADYALPSSPASPRQQSQLSFGLADRALFDSSDVTCVPAEPTHVRLPVVHTPCSDSHLPVLPDLNLLVGGALAPVHTPKTLLQRQRPSRPRRPPSGLRLPSFELLGIAGMHDRFGDVMAISAGEDAMLPDSIFSKAMDAVDIAPTLVSSPTKPKLPPGLVQTPFRHDVATLTPPAETEPAWRTTILANLSNAPMDSRSAGLAHLPSPSLQSGHPRSDVAASQANSEPDSDADSPAWIDGALNILVNNVRSAAIPNNPLRVLSHALPVPSDSGHIYSTILEKIGANTPSNPPTWINVFHAISGKFNLPDIPTSPPSTPGPPSGTDDYFTQKIFASAVPISDYQDDLSALPRTPRPIVPPSTVNIAVVERYIPPSSTNEFKDMFSPSGPSLLVDRLVELSPAGGTLVFIYPTKTGATTFMQEYLGPILDPLLRSTQVVNGLSANLSQDLGSMAAAKELQEFEQMQKSIEALCARLAQRNRGRFATVYASKAQVKIGRTAWAKDWWPKQEYPRIKETVTRATQEAQKKTSNRYIERASTPTELVGRLVDGVLKNQYPSGQEPTSGIEVSVFVIQRSL